MLRWFGIAAHSALGNDPDITRVRLRADILTDFPDAEGAYLFWTAGEDQARFTPDGEVTGWLTAYVAGSSTGRAARAAFDSVGCSVVEGPDPGTLLIGLTG